MWKLKLDQIGEILEMLTTSKIQLLSIGDIITFRIHCKTCENFHFVGSVEIGRMHNDKRVEIKIAETMEVNKCPEKTHQKS